MNTQNNKLFFDYKDKDCNYCPTKPILDQFKNYTGSPEDCERLKNYIATEIGHTKPTYTSNVRAPKQPPTVYPGQQHPFNANQPQQDNLRQQQLNKQKPYSTHYNPTPRIDLKSVPFKFDLNKYNQTNDPNSVPRSSVPIGCCNNTGYICFKTSSPSSPPILIQGPPCQTNNNSVSCCIQNSYNQVLSSNQVEKPQRQLVNQKQLTQVNKAVKCLPNRRKRPEPCNRENCVHKTPESICLYGQPCKAHCFNTPPAGRRNA